MKNIFYTLAFLTLTFSPIQSQEKVNHYVKPDHIKGIENPQISLNGDWQFQYIPKGTWEIVQVPGELAMQGYAIEHDKPYTYKKSFVLPKDYQKKEVILRFDGVYSQAKLSINGKYVRNHNGGFSRWEANITPFVQINRDNVIELEIIDPLNDISYASGYAHHPIGGILRDVTIYALPEQKISDFIINTNLDSLYQDGSLEISFTAAKVGKINFALIDPKGKKVSLKNHTLITKKGFNQISFNLKKPIKWDSEHPNLYTLQVKAESPGKYDMSFSRKVGFRDVCIVGNQMFINGQPIKLRGACRHDMHPTLGRSTNAELDSLDALRFKQSNMNFVRTSHYPPTECFVEFCDKMGIYVECETAICFVNTYRQKNYAPGNSENDTAFESHYLEQLEEMIQTMRNHPSVIFWSIGNESRYGSNFQRSYDWVKEKDHTRPVIFSYPGTVEKGKKVFDLLSFHYPETHGNLKQFGVTTEGFENEDYPSLFDEWAHVPCYTYSTLQEDPNIREFWGQSLDRMWKKLFDTKGGLGGAIWGYCDETFMLPEPTKGTPYWIEFARTAKPLNYQGKCVGYGEWGIVDVWRREKPEFWGTKKAYSPIRITETNIKHFSSELPLYIPIYNRFDHTNLKEVQVLYTYKGKEQSIQGPNLDPHKKGYLILDSNEWEAGNELFIQFLDKNNQLIDAERIILGHQKNPIQLTINKEDELSMKENENYLIISGKNFEIPFEKSSGLITNAKSNGLVIMEKGPFINLDLNFNHNTGAEVRKKANNFILNEKCWKKDSLFYNKEGNDWVICLKGKYENIAVSFKIRIQRNGCITFNYNTTGEPNGWLRESGLKFIMPNTIEKIAWTRDGYWSYYPEGAFAGHKGEAKLYNSKKVAYGENPNQEWNKDTHNYYYFADAGINIANPLTAQAKGMKENIYSYKLCNNKDAGLEVISNDCSVACRINRNKDGELIVYTNNRWDYPEIAWGNYCKTLNVYPNKGYITIQF